MDKRKFMHLGSKAQCHIAEKMSEEIEAAIMRYSDQIPLALAIGVLNIIGNELINRHSYD